MVRGVPRNQAELSRPIEEVSIGDIVLWGRGWEGKETKHLRFSMQLVDISKNRTVVRLVLLTGTVKGRRM